MNNLHISLTPFTHESRVLKEAMTIVSGEIVEKVYIAALHEGDLAVSEKICERIELKRFRLFTRNFSKSLIVQLIKYVEFCLRVVLNYRLKKISIVNVHCLGLLPLGIMCKIFYQSKLIYDAHELETETEGLKGVRKSLSKIAELICLKFVDETIVVGESIADWYVNQYKMRRPLVVLNCPRQVVVSKRDIFREKFQIPNESIIFLYQGGLSSGRGIETILRTFKQINEIKYCIVFMGDGELCKMVQSNTITHRNIFWHSPVPPSVLLEYTSSADVGFCTISNSCLSYYYCLPNKLFEYTMAEIPSIVTNLFELRKVVETDDIGWILEKEEVDDLVVLVRSINFFKISKKKENVRKASEKFYWEKQEEKLLALYRNNLSPRSIY